MVLGAVKLDPVTVWTMVGPNSYRIELWERTGEMRDGVRGSSSVKRRRIEGTGGAV